MNARDDELIQAAREVRQRSYSPYSGFAVGAALRGKSGKIYTGTNVENASYPLTICAERAAVCKALSEGEQEFEALAVVSRTGATPCGACRQVLAEFGTDIRVLIADAHACLGAHTVAELLPHGFDRSKLA
ncbi:MAG: cytidine deaminase [Chloroflexi bacterium]|nr:cytidine deaminase [Chloroflexota bacterium]MBI3733289.1 cytidine deaminase [Chloroflexota bacterium]